MIGCCLYINLLKRADRAREIQHELRILVSHIFPRVLIQHVIASERTPGFMGCTASHIRALQLALVLKQEWSFIVEDDFLLHNVTGHQVQRTLKEIFDSIGDGERSGKNPKVNVIMLQANVHSSTINGKLEQIHVALCTAGYLVRYEYISTLIHNCQKSLTRKIPVDVGYTQLQKDGTWFAPTTKIGVQRPSFSDIESRFVNYKV